MAVRILSQSDVEALLPMERCVEVMGDALGALARGNAGMPLRSLVWKTDRSGLLGLMPAYLDAPPTFGLKAITVMPGNHGTEHDAHQGVVLLFEADHGCLRAILDATAITAIRTAAVSALATRLLARDDAGDLALLGSGVQAASHLRAMRVVRTLRSVRVWSRSREAAQRFAEREGPGCGLTIEVCGTARKAVQGADLICTTTAAREPVLEGAWIAPGAHVNAVGACIPTARELDTEAVRRARFFVDSRESARHEAGDFLIPLSEGAISEDHIAGELGEVVVGRVPGRQGPEEVTLFESLGLGIEDLAAALAVLARADDADRGTVLELGGHRS
jgi:ornithine cyclodeaminase